MDNIITVNKKLYDKLVSKDKIDKSLLNHRSPFYTEVTATDEFGNVLFSKRQNETVLGGALTVLEKLCSITKANAQFKVASINSLLDINNTIALNDSTATNNDILCLWGIGIGGSGDAFGSRREVKFYEREIGRNGFTAEMIPFRVVTQRFANNTDEGKMYFMSKQKRYGNVDLYEYYLKRFENKDEIKTYVLWQDGAEGEDGNPVESNVYSLNRSDNIEAFIELRLKLTKKDAREYFEVTNSIEQARINTIGLFTGRRVEVETGRYDYVNVKMFSKLTFENESLQNAKVINFNYRIYVS